MHIIKCNSCGLGKKLTLKKAVSKAHKYVNKAILYAPDIGEGNGPLNLSLIHI